MFKKTLLLAVILSAVILACAAYACTDFQIKATDGSVVIGRSMEFAMGITSDVVIYPRKAKYGYLGIDAFGEKAAMLDGMNEAGLAVEFLWFTESQYPTAKDGKGLAITDLGHWILGNFSSVDEVKRELSKIKVVGVYVPQFRSVPGFHAAVHDAAGKSIVIEFVNGETRIYDNPIGVMTNKPTFDWHLTNLRNYVNLDPYDIGSKNIGGAKFEQAGSGSGWLGMPGDWTPPSRFVRTVQIVHSADPVKNAAEAVNLAEHVLNAVDIPRGVVRSRDTTDKNLVDYTQWVVIKDLKNLVLYFRSYQDLALKKVEMRKLDLKPGAAMKTVRIESGARTIVDVTDKLK